MLAEGSQQPEQVELLQQLDCGHAQGYYFGHPQPATKLAKLLVQQRSAVYE